MAYYSFTHPETNDVFAVEVDNNSLRKDIINLIKVKSNYEGEISFVDVHRIQKEQYYALQERYQSQWSYYEVSLSDGDGKGAVKINSSLDGQNLIEEIASRFPNSEVLSFKSITKEEWDEFGLKEESFKGTLDPASLPEGYVKPTVLHYSYNTMFTSPDSINYVMKELSALGVQCNVINKSSFEKILEIVIKEKVTQDEILIIGVLIGRLLSKQY